MPPASQPGAPPLVNHPTMAQSRQTTPPTAIGHLLRSRIEPILVEVVFIDFQGSTHQRCRTGKACVRDRFQCARSTRSDGLTFVVDKRVVVHGLFRLFHGHLLWNIGPLPHRQPLPAYILTEMYVGIVSARFVKGDSSIHPGHTSLQSPTERPTHHDRMDRPIHPTCLRCLSTWSWPGRVAAARLATVQPRTIAVCDPRERLAPPRPTVRISSPGMLSYTIGSRQGLSYTFRTFSTVNLDCLDTIRISPVFRTGSSTLHAHWCCSQPSR